MLDLNFYRQKLETNLKTIVAELETIGIYDAQTDNWEAIPEQVENQTDADLNTNADIVEEWNERRATLQDLEKDYRNIKRALAKIDTGNYGVCEISGEAIEEKRLQFIPEARTCMAHMEEEGQLSI
ncbi:MAG TPA: TraR/DksA C4-type zinc finger protein [Candidatus Paceibacterota bacterium]|nr:TraR/DksA C4-type zinc finger protein [Candidatus Paceibacterota bacterium]HMO82635.1 TraR/DksA C4-type zinc finger protein [Candidatus Paceibacterota bacterium]